LKFASLAKEEIFRAQSEALDSIRLTEDKLKAVEVELVRLREEVERAEGRVREKVRVEVSKVLEALMQTHFKGMTFRP
jgi:hypothetical protein